MSKRTTIWKRAGAVTAIVAAALVAGCSQKQDADQAVVSDKVYGVMPESVTVAGALVSGQITDMKVVERVEQGTGRIDAPARLKGKLTLKNVSADKSVRLIGGTLVYLDASGQSIKLAESRIEPTLRLTASYGASDRLDPGQNAVQSIDVDFPAEALKAGSLKDIRLDLSYTASPYTAQAMNFGVTVSLPQSVSLAQPVPAAQQ